MSEALRHLLSWRGRHVRVVGDLMLDVYEHAVRVPNPENFDAALGVREVHHFPGGAANAAWVLDALGASVHLVGVVGDDPEGNKLYRELAFRSGVSSDGVMIDASRPTTTKRRTLWDGRPFARCDYESKAPLADRTQESIVKYLREARPPAATLFSDYGKGMLTPDVVAAAFGRSGITVLDPKADLARFRPVNYVTPNTRELDALGGPEAVQEKTSAVVVETAGDFGAFVYDGVSSRVPTVSVAGDTCGAGDSFAAAFTLAVANGAAPEDAALLGNAVARWFVQQPRGKRPSTHDIENQLLLIEEVTKCG